jgi:hypothetical protein
LEAIASELLSNPELIRGLDFRFRVPICRFWVGTGNNGGYGARFGAWSAEDRAP